MSGAALGLRLGRREQVWPAAVLALLALPLICYRLDGYSLVNGDEAIYHAIAESMVASGNWFRLDFNGEQRVWDTVMNAPIQYWARALLIQVFGGGLWTTRILSALCGVASVLMTYRLVLYLGGRGPAFLAGLLQLTTLQFVYLHSARTGELETGVTLLLTATAYLFLRTLETGRSFIGHHFCLVLMLNLKLPTVAIPVLAELACFALLPATRVRLRDWVLCSAWILPLGLSWHLLQMTLLWEPFWDVLGKMGAKAAGDAGVLSRLWGNAKFYGSTLLFGAFPYVLAYPVALVAVLQNGLRDGELRRWIPLVLFALAVLCFYLPLAERNQWYVIPAYPFLSALLAVWMFRIAKTSPSAALIAATGAIASVICWTSVDATTFNPFADQANRIAMPVDWRRGLIAPILGVPLTAGAIAALLWLARTRLATVFPIALAVAMGVALIGLGSLRVLAPLRHLGYQSEMARLRSDLDAALAEGRPIRLPIDVGEPLGGRASYYFADEFDLVPVRSQTRLPQPIYFQLREKSGH